MDCDICQGIKIMSENNKQPYIDFDEYIRQGEPSQKEDKYRTTYIRMMQILSV